MESAVLESEPAVLMPNWELAKVLYAQGIEHAEVADKAGVSLTALRKRITRGKWTLLRADTSDATKQLESKPAGSEAVITASTKVREGIAARLESHVAALAGLSQPKTLKAVERENDALAQLIQNAKIIFQWADTGSTTTFNTFNFSARTVGTIEPIDIKSELVEPKQVTPPPEQ